MVSYEKKGKPDLNDNDTAKGWGANQVGGLIAKFKGKPELSADHFDGLSASARIKDGETKDQIAAYRETLTDSEQVDLLVNFTLEPRNVLKCVIKEITIRALCCAM